jgi:hypothetical protein
MQLYNVVISGFLMSAIILTFTKSFSQTNLKVGSAVFLRSQILTVLSEDALMTLKSSEILTFLTFLL